MSFYSINKAEERKDKIKSAIITAIIWTALLLFVFFYTITQTFPKETEAVNTMLVNFGDNRNGNGIEEPANQEGSLAAKTDVVEPQPVEEAASKSETVIDPQPKVETKKVEVKDKVISGNNTKAVIPKKEDAKNSKSSKSTVAASASNNKKTSATTTNSKTGNGDGKGTAAIGNLIKGRGTKAGSQGTGTGIGNNGDPVGGDGDGDSKIGVDRRLVGFIPGTMGRGGAQPTHNCSGNGTISIAYTVDKAGNVVSARRAGGVSDPCIVSTSVSWVKKYVKAERAGSSSSGTYKISF